MKGFVINKAYADNALDKRSMFQRDYYILLMYFALTPLDEIPKELKDTQKAIKKARLLDLVIRLSWHTAVQTLSHSWHNLQHAWDEPNKLKSFVAVPYRALCLPLSALSTAIMLPVNMIYGLLDWASLKVALAFVKHRAKQSDDAKDMIKKASYLALFSSILTIPLRLPVGLVEAFQEPLHLYDFWVKGGVDTWKDYQASRISGWVCTAKLALHTFKVVCTFGAVLSIVGITVGPVLKALSKTAHFLIHLKDLLPNAHLIDMPVNTLKHTMVGMEHVIAKTVGVHYSYMSMRTNTNRAIELGFESCLTKGAATLPQQKGYGPTDFVRGLRTF